MKTTLLLLLTSFALTAQLPIDMERIDSIFNEWSDGKSPGASVGIYSNGKLIFSKGYGKANLDYNIDNDAHSIFRIASTSKQFTAACIVLLAEEGKLSFDDKLSRYFPDFPSYADTITIRHLLNHTSGLRDYLTVSSLKGLREDDYYTDDEIEQWLSRQEQINFTPGDEMVYSNSGYWILGQIVEKASAQNMRDYADLKLFTPLGMSHTHFHNNHNEVVPNRATGYYPSLGGYDESRTTLDMIGDGGIFTSISDLAAWDNAYYDRSILSDFFWDEMTRTGKLNNGEDIDYASGLFMSEYKGLPMISHGGAFVGYRAQYMRFPDQKIGIAVLCNRGDANPTAKARAIANIILADKFVEEKEDKKAVAKSTKPTKSAPIIPFDMLAGDYQLNPGVVITVTDETDSLKVLQQWNGEVYGLERTQSNSFQVINDADVVFEFSNVEDGQSQSCTIQQGSRSFELKRKKALDMSGIDLNAYVGSYYSQELDAHYHISLDGDDLMLQIENRKASKITIDSKEVLFGNVGQLDMIFKGAAVVGFKLDAGRAKNIGFVRE